MAISVPKGLGGGEWLWLTQFLCCAYTVCVSTWIYDGSLEHHTLPVVGHVLENDCILEILEHAYY